MPLDINGQEVSGLNCYPSMTLDYLSYVKFFIGDKKPAKSLCTQAIESARVESDCATASVLSNSCFTQIILGRRYKPTTAEDRRIVLLPKSPKLNGCVERANGTTRYDFYPL